MRVDLRSIAKAAEADPRKAMLEAVGPMTDYELFHNTVLVATYVAPETTTGGIILPDKTMQEDRFQGKVGLVIAKGPLAFKDDAIAKFGGVDVEVGDWVFFRPSDGIEMFIKSWLPGATQRDGISVRLFEDTLIKGRVRDPSLIY